LLVGAAAAVVVVLVVLVVVVPVVVVDEQPPEAGATKSPCFMCAGTARSLTMISTKGCFFECVRWQTSTLPGLLGVVVVVVLDVVVVPVVVVLVVVVPVVVDPVVVVPVVVVVVVVVCCEPAMPNGPLLLASAIDVPNPAASSARSTTLSFMVAACLQGGCGVTALDAAARHNLRSPAAKSLERVS
jgi:hypothetical protein